MKKKNQAKGQYINDMFAMMTAQEVVEHLNAESLRQSEYVHEHILLEHELIEREHLLAEVSVKLMQLEEEKKAKMEEFKTQIDPLKESQHELIDSLKNKCTMQAGTVYVFLNDNKDDVTLTDSRGIIIEQRGLFDNERQLTIGR